MSQRTKARVEQLDRALHQARGLRCREAPDKWFPESYVQVWVKEPIELCLACPMRQPCLELAELRGEPHGIAGGMTPEQRRVRRQRGIGPGEPAPSEREEVA